MSARDVIARALFETDRSDIRTADWSDQYESVRNKFREQADRLTAAGYRILGPDEVDPVTRERCAQIVERSAPADTGKWCPYRSWALRSLPAIRSLGDGR